MNAPKGTPIPMRLHCPARLSDGSMCGVLHVDEGDFATRPHHTHACQTCGNTWRPAIVPTVGVQFLPGFRTPLEAQSVAELDIKAMATHTQRMIALAILRDDLEDFVGIIEAEEEQAGRPLQTSAEVAARFGLRCPGIQEPSTAGATRYDDGDK